jgi:Ankyrin repeats (3 copies)
MKSRRPVNCYVRRFSRMLKQRILIGAFLSVFLFGCSRFTEDKAFAWVSQNNGRNLEDWLKAGGDPNLRNHEGCTLLYVATGPHGGDDVLRILIAHQARVDEGCGRNTPLMNAASWLNSDAVGLLNSGADPFLKDHNGYCAIDLIGQGNAAEQARIRQSLLAAPTRR